MPNALTGLVRVTVTVLDRRIDLALPDDRPVADVLPDIVRHAGAGFAAGAARGGWVLRRADGAALSNANTLRAQGVRDGQALVIVPADAMWPEPEYDDIVEAVATTGRLGLPWSPAATRWSALAAGAVTLLIGATALLRGSAAPTAAALAAGIALVLLGAGALVARSAAGGRIAVACGALAIVYAAGAGWLAADAAVSRLLAGSAGAIVAGLTALVLIGAVNPVFIAGTGAGVAGCAVALLTRAVPVPSAAAILVACLALLAGAVPSAAIRLGGLARGDVDRLAASVARTDDWIVGLCLSGAIAAGVASIVVVTHGGAWAMMLTAVCAGALGLRSRVYAAVRQRLAAAGSGLAVAAPLVTSAVWTSHDPLLLGGGCAAAGIVIMVAAAIAGCRPYLARAADIVEVGCIVAVLPALCGVVGMYTRLRGLT